MKIMPLLLCSLFLASCSSTSKNADNHSLFLTNPDFPKISDDSIYIFHSAFLSGQTGDCGCKHSPRGGLEKRKKYLLEIKGHENALILDSGNSLIPIEGTSAASSAPDTLNRDAQKLKSFAEDMGYAAINYGESEATFTALELKDSEAAPLISGNIKNVTSKTRISKTPIIKTIKGKKLLIIGLGELSKKTEGLIESDWKVALKQTAKENPDLIVVLSSLKYKTIKELMPKVLSKSFPTTIVLGSSSEYKSPLAHKLSSNLIYFDYAGMMQNMGYLRLKSFDLKQFKSEKRLVPKCGTDGTPSQEPVCYGVFETL